MKKIIALDLDGTLLLSDHTIGEDTRATLHRLALEGHHITIATGRILSSARAIPQMLGFDCHLVGCNGALVQHKDDYPVVRHVFSKTLVSQILDILFEENIYFHLYTEDTIYCNRYEHIALKFKKMLNKGGPGHVKDVVLVENPDHVFNLGDHIYKFGIYQDDTYDFDRVRARLDALEGVDTLFSNHNLLDLMLKGVSKWTGIAELAASLQVDNADILVFGDNENDIEMIKGAGVGVVMGNAHDDIKAHGDFVTQTNDQEGIHNFLVDYLKG